MDRNRTAADVTEVWEAHSKAAKVQTALEDPAKFLQTCASFGQR